MLDIWLYIAEDSSVNADRMLITPWLHIYGMSSKSALLTPPYSPSPFILLSGIAQILCESLSRL